MRKTIYVLIILSCSVAVMGYGMSLEAESLLVNGVAVLELVIPALTFLLTQIFILMFEKENKPWIILGTALAIGLLANLFTIGYYSLALEDLNGGIWNPAMLVILASGGSLISFKLFVMIGSVTSHHPKLKG